MIFSNIINPSQAFMGIRRIILTQNSTDFKGITFRIVDICEMTKYSRHIESTENHIYNDTKLVTMFLSKMVPSLLTWVKWDLTTDHGFQIYNVLSMLST